MREYKPEIDGFKGILIILILVGHNHWIYGLAGDAALFGPGEVYIIIFFDIVLVTAFFGTLRLAYQFGTLFFPIVGRYSMQIFLLHQLVWQTFWLGVGYKFSADTGPGQMMLVFISTTSTLAVTFYLSRYIMSQNISKFVFPKSVTEWTASFNRRAIH